MEGVYRRVERWIEGPRDARIRRNLGPWTAGKVWRKAMKGGIFLFLAFLNAHVFVAYFIPARELLSVVRGNPADHWTAFLWIMSWTVVLLFDYAWFREQTCLIVCPYGRLQSALIDADTVIIGYDEVRGEPRSKRTDQGGDCIDCFRCVAACPTGIDIRNGLQMECIGCANCVDACDDVMRRIGRPEGLVRYDSERGFRTGRRRGFFRARVALYAVLALAGVGVFGAVSLRRTPFEVRVLRSTGLPYQLDGAVIRNIFTLRIQNKMSERAVFFVRIPEETDESPGVAEAGAAAALPDFTVPQPRLEIDALADVKTPIIAAMPRDRWEGPFPLTVSVADSATGRTRSVRVRFRGP
jgi:cytochrome c oxidase accessory protein FixG